MDTSFKFLESLCNLKESKRLHVLIDIGVCQLHTMHEAFKTGAVKSTWNIHSFESSVANIP